jgi:hypothetical protein
MAHGDVLTLDLPIGDHVIDYTQEDFTRSDSATT